MVEIFLGIPDMQPFHIIGSVQNLIVSFSTISFHLKVIFCFASANRLHIKSSFAVSPSSYKIVTHGHQLRAQPNPLPHKADKRV